MKHILFIIFVLSSLFLASCEQNPRYSPLDGFWQVTTVENKSLQTISDAEGRFYMSFECELVKLTYYPAVHNKGTLGHEYVSSFTLQDGVLALGTFYKYSYDISKTEKELAPANEMASFGIYEQPASFRLSMEKRTMTLENDEARIILRKY